MSTRYQAAVALATLRDVVSRLSEVATVRQRHIVVLTNRLMSDLMHERLNRAVPTPAADARPGWPTLASNAEVTEGELTAQVQWIFAAADRGHVSLHVLDVNGFSFAR